jgi:hypothetical protein
MRRSILRALVATTLLGGAVTLSTTGCVERKSSSITGSGSIDIISISASPDTIFINEQSLITAVIDNPNGEQLTYSWQAFRGAVNGSGPEVRYFGSYCCAGTDWVVLTVTDAGGGKVSESVVLHVFDVEN